MKKLLFYGLVLSLHFPMAPRGITVQLAENRTAAITSEQFNQLKAISGTIKDMTEDFPGEDITSLELQPIGQQSFEYILEIGQLSSEQQKNRLSQLSDSQLHRLILSSDYLAAEKLLKNALKEFASRNLPFNLPRGLRMKMMGLQLFEAVAENNLEKVKQALKAGARINTRGEKGWTPLHSAIQLAVQRNYKDYEMIIKFLLGYGADPTIKDDEGKTPIDRAVPRPALIQLLLEAGE